MSPSDPHRSALKRALARAHGETARAKFSRDKWRARALESQDEKSRAEAQSELNPESALRSELVAVKSMRDGLMVEVVKLQEKVSGLESKTAANEFAGYNAVCAERDEIGKRYNAEISRREESEGKLKGLRFELDRAVKLGTRPPSAMLEDMKRILVGEA